MARRGLWRWRRLVALIVLMVALYATGLGVFLALLPEPTAGMPGLAQVDGLVVFTGGSNRVVTGLELLHEGFAGPLLISGVHRDVQLRQMAALARKSGTPLDAAQQQQVTLDSEAASTNANVVNTLMWADTHHVRRLGVVTSTYHVLRCRILFWWYGALARVDMLPVQPAVSGFRPLLHEYNKVLLLPLLPLS